MNAVVERRLTAKLVVDHEHHDVQVRLLWVEEHPVHVQLLIRFDDEPIGWTFPRHLLTDGLAVSTEEAAVTDGWVRVWSSPLRLFVDVDAESGMVRYALSRGQAVAFLAAVDVAVDAAVEAELAALLGRTP